MMSISIKSVAMGLKAHVILIVYFAIYTSITNYYLATQLAPPMILLDCAPVNIS